MSLSALHFSAIAARAVSAPTYAERDGQIYSVLGKINGQLNFLLPDLHSPQEFIAEPNEPLLSELRTLQKLLSAP